MIRLPRRKTEKVVTKAALCADGIRAESLSRNRSGQPKKCL